MNNRPLGKGEGDGVPGKRSECVFGPQDLRLSSVRVVGLFEGVYARVGTASVGYERIQMARYSYQ